MMKYVRTINPATRDQKFPLARAPKFSVRLLNKASWYRKQSKPWSAGAILIRRRAFDTSKVKAVSSNAEPVKGAACNTSEILGSNILLGMEVFCVTPETVESTTSRGALLSAQTKPSLPTAVCSWSSCN